MKATRRGRASRTLHASVADHHEQAAARAAARAKRVRDRDGGARRSPVWPLVTIAGAAICGATSGIWGSVAFTLAMLSAAGWLSASASVVRWSGQASATTALAAAIVSYVALILLFGVLLYTRLIDQLPPWSFASGLVVGVTVYAVEHIRRSWSWSQAP